MVTYSLSPLKPSPHHPHVLFLSLYIRTLSLPWMYVCYYGSVFHIHFTLPHGFSLHLPHTSQVFTSCPIPLPLYSYFILPLVLCYYVFISQFLFTLPCNFLLPPSHTALSDLMTLSFYYHSMWFPPKTPHVHPV